MFGTYYTFLIGFWERENLLPHEIEDFSSLYFQIIKLKRKIILATLKFYLENCYPFITKRLQSTKEPHLLYMFYDNIHRNIHFTVYIPFIHLLYTINILHTLLDV